jgi:hypothetical protein
MFNYGKIRKFERRYEELLNLFKRLAIETGVLGGLSHCQNVDYIVKNYLEDKSEKRQAKRDQEKIEAIVRDLLKQEIKATCLK